MAERYEERALRYLGPIRCNSYEGPSETDLDRLTELLQDVAKEAQLRALDRALAIASERHVSYSCAISAGIEELRGAIERGEDV